VRTSRPACILGSGGTRPSGQTCAGPCPASSSAIPPRAPRCERSSSHASLWFPSQKARARRTRRPARTVPRGGGVVGRPTTQSSPSCSQPTPRPTPALPGSVPPRLPSGSPNTLVLTLRLPAEGGPRWRRQQPQRQQRQRQRWRRRRLLRHPSCRWAASSVDASKRRERTVSGQVAGRSSGGCRSSDPTGGPVPAA
jgi:hypothetical protein